MDLNNTWKLSADDWRESERWDDFDRPYEDELSACSTENAIWHIVPTDHKGSVTWPSATRVCRPCTRLARHGVRHSRRRGASAAQKSRRSIRTPGEFRTNAAADGDDDSCC